MSDIKLVDWTKPLELVGVASNYPYTFSKYLGVINEPPAEWATTYHICALKDGTGREILCYAFPNGVVSAFRFRIANMPVKHEIKVHVYKHNTTQEKCVFDVKWNDLHGHTYIGSFKKTIVEGEFEV